MNTRSTRNGDILPALLLCTDEVTDILPEPVKIFTKTGVEESLQNVEFTTEVLPFASPLSEISVESMANGEVPVD